MKKPSFSAMIIMVATAVVVILIASAAWRNSAPSQYDDLAQCITDNGGRVYTAYWCGHCSNQEAMFGSAWRLLDVVECSSPGSDTFDLCPNIIGTPTWEKADGSFLEGAYQLEDLATEFGCEQTLEQL